jgi:hypothetical protein
VGSGAPHAERQANSRMEGATRRQRQVARRGCDLRRGLAQHVRTPRSWALLALGAALAAVPSTESAADIHASMHTVHGRPALPTLLRSALPGPCLEQERRRREAASVAAVGFGAGEMEQERRRREAVSVASLGIASAGKVSVETVSLRGHEIPLHLRGVLSGFAGGLAGSSVSFLQEVAKVRHLVPLFGKYNGALTFSEILSGSIPSIPSKLSCKQK